MYSEAHVPGPEYRVRAVQRFVVTRYCHPFTSADGKIANSGSSEVIAELPNEQRAFEVAQAMAKTEPGATIST